MGPPARPFLSPKSPSPFLGKEQSWQSYTQEMKLGATGNLQLPATQYGSQLGEFLSGAAVSGPVSLRFQIPLCRNTDIPFPWPVQMKLLVLPNPS